MDYWQGPSRWINAALLFIVTVIAFDAVFLLLGALDSNPIVWLVDRVSGLFLAPFAGMFRNQPELATQGLAVLVWVVVATIALAVVRSVQTSRAQRRRALMTPEAAPPPPPSPRARPPVPPAPPQGGVRPARAPRPSDEATVRRPPAAEQEAPGREEQAPRPRPRTPR